MTNGNEPISEVKWPDTTIMCDGNDTWQFIKDAKPFLGLTKREYFAAMAMQGLLSNPDVTKGIAGMVKEGLYSKEYGQEVLQEMAIISADQLIKYLNK